MPPKRCPSKRNVGKKKAAAQEAPASDNDAKPNVDSLNAEEELPSDPIQAQTEQGSKPTAETPASTSAPPTRRLDSLNQAGSGSTATRGKRLVTAPRNAVRRSHAQRAELQRAEEEKRKFEEVRAAKEAAKAREEALRRDAGRGNARGRGRGGYMGESNRTQAVASGPFSAGQVDQATKRLNRKGPNSSGWRGWKVQSSTVESTSAAPDQHPPSKKSARRDGNKATTKQEAGPSTETKPALDANGDVSMQDLGNGVTAIDGGYISSDEDVPGKHGKRMNVEDLGVIDLTQDDVEIDPFAPVRVARIAHRDRALGINAAGATDQEGAVAVDANDVATIATSEKRKGKQRANEVEFVSEKHDFQAVYSDSESDGERQPRIKEEKAGDEDGPPTPEPVLAPSSKSEAKRKSNEKNKSRAFSSDSLPGELDYQTREDKEEWERHQQDLQIIRSELGWPASAGDGDGDAAMTEIDRPDNRAEKVYLFQFPPVLPDLVPVLVKPDPEAVNGDANTTDAMEVDQPNDKSKPITIQDDGKPEAHRPQLPSGAVGKLKVHASGRVTLDWGGTSLALGMGTGTSFLQDVLVATLPDQKDDTKDGTAVAEVGQAVSMGQVKGKFVLTPDWEELLG